MSPGNTQVLPCNYPSTANRRMDSYYSSPENWFLVSPPEIIRQLWGKGESLSPTSVWGYTSWAVDFNSNLYFSLSFSWIYLPFDQFSILFWECGGFKALWPLFASFLGVNPSGESQLPRWGHSCGQRWDLHGRNQRHLPVATEGVWK